MVVVVVLSFFYFGFGYTTQGYSPGVRKFGCTKITGGFLPVLCFAGNISSLQDLVFPSAISIGFNPKQKKSGRGRDKFSTVYFLQIENCQNHDSISHRCRFNQINSKLRIYSSTIGDAF